MTQLIRHLIAYSQKLKHLKNGLVKHRYVLEDAVPIAGVSLSVKASIAILFTKYKHRVSLKFLFAVTYVAL